MVLGSDTPNRGKIFKKKGDIRFMGGRRTAREMHEWTLSIRYGYQLILPIMCGV
jgi:hypothetical protein